MRLKFVIVAVCMLTGVSLSRAADTTPAPDSNATPQSAPAQTCVDVRIGNDRSAYMNCLNQQMQQRAEHEHDLPQPAAPIDAQSQSNEVGTANDAAAREKMGNAFGKSAEPQRPKPVFVNPLVPAASH